MASRERRCTGRRDVFFIVMILLFVGNIYFIASRYGKGDQQGHGHEHGHKHKDDTSQEHITDQKFMTPPYISIIVPLYNQLQYPYLSLDILHFRLYPPFHLPPHLLLRRFDHTNVFRRYPRVNLHSIISRL